jgi:homoserine O-acetyltransferase
MLRIVAALALLLLPLAAAAADYPGPRTGDWVAPNFKFHTGEVISALKLHYTTVGDPAGTPVVVLHGSGGSAASMLTPPSPANYSVPASHSTRQNITSSFPMPLVTAPAPSRPTGLKPNFRNTIMPTWLMPNTGCCPKDSASIMYG